jgi:hypothetical protein
LACKITGNSIGFVIGTCGSGVTKVGLLDQLS